MSSKTRYAILGLLAVEPMSGYQMRQSMKTKTAYFWSESDGQLYPTLAQLQKEGLIEMFESAGEGKRDKKTYNITDAGREELQTWLAAQPETQSVRSEFMLKLFFGGNVAPNINLEHVEAQRYEAKAAVQQLEVMRKQLIEKQKDSPHLPYWLMSLDHGLKIGKAKLEWSEDVIRTLKAMSKKTKA